MGRVVNEIHVGEHFVEMVAVDPEELKDLQCQIAHLKLLLVERDKKIAELIKEIQACESTFRKINSKNEQASVLSLAAMKNSGVDKEWPGGIFEDIAEMAQGRASLCYKAITSTK